ncbi:MAG: hypothetical protein AAF668_15700 [Pseudomonadota bacterium]
MDNSRARKIGQDAAGRALGLKHFLFVLITLGLLFSRATAQTFGAPVSDPFGTIKSYDIDTIEPILKEITPLIERIEFIGAPALVASFGDTNLILRPNACSKGPEISCAGLFHMTLYKTALNLSRLNTYNMESFIAHAANSADGSSLLIRYAFCDYGCTRGTLVAGIANYIIASQEYAQTLSSLGAVEVNADAAVAGSKIQANGASQPSGRLVSFELPQAMPGLHQEGSLEANRLTDWVADDLFSED